MVTVSPVRFRPALHVGIESPRHSDRAAGREHHFGGFGGDLASGLGLSGLQDERPALHRPRDIQRTANSYVGGIRTGAG
jgi:hypothetical protein